MLEESLKEIAKRIIDKVERIKGNPFLFVEKLKGIDLYKLRVGDYRAILSIENGKMVIFVLEVDHRSVIYRKY